MRAEVKPVAGVAEVGRIRVTDQRGPCVSRRGPGKPRRWGPGSHRERVSRAKRARAPCIRLFASARSRLHLPSSPPYHRAIPSPFVPRVPFVILSSAPLSAQPSSIVRARASILLLLLLLSRRLPASLALTLSTTFRPPVSSPSLPPPSPSRSRLSLPISLSSRRVRRSSSPRLRSTLVVLSPGRGAHALPFSPPIHSRRLTCPTTT